MLIKEMKDSSVDWFGNVPKDWQHRKIGNYFHQVKDKNNDLLEKNLLSLSYGSIIRRDINTSDGLLPANFSGYNIVLPGDIVLRMTDLQNDQKSLRTGYVKEKGIITSAYITIRPKNITLINSKYIHLLLHSFDITKGFYGMGNGVRQNVTYNDIKKLPIMLPTKEIQDKIIDLLEIKLKNINFIIDKTKQSIKELKRYKELIITEAVTKGLNQEVKMKDSGVMGFGKVVGSWKKGKIKNIVSTKITDGPHETPQLLNHGIPFVSAEAVKNGIINLQYKRGYISVEDHIKFSGKVSPRKNDIFIVKSGATTGNVGIVETEEVFDIWSPLALIRVNKKVVNNKFVYYFLSSDIFKNQVRLNWSFGTQQNIGMGVIERLNIFYPDLNEQQEIVSYLDKQTNKIDILISDKENVIKELENYEKSLIYEYVTGKKEV